MLHQMQDKLNELKSTQEKIHHISAALGKGRATAQQVGTVAESLGIKMDENDKQAASKLPSNELIAHTMAARILA